MNSGDWHRQLRQNRKPDADDHEEKGNDRQRLAFGQAGEKGLNRVEHSGRQARQEYGKQGEIKGDAQDHAQRVRQMH